MISDSEHDSVSNKIEHTDFQSDFFQKQAYLTVSGQLSAETYATALSDVYTFGPTFRAEKSDTSRHLAEFYMVEPEMSFCDMHEAMANAENYIKFVLQYSYTHCREDMDFFNKYHDKHLFNRILKYIEPNPSTGETVPFVRLSYHDAVHQLQIEINKNRKKWLYPNLKLGDDLHSEHEKWLSGQKYKDSCIFIYNYPRNIKSFYMRDGEYINDIQVVSAFDLIVPKIGELVGGSQREERLDILVDKIEEFGLNIDNYDWYLDLRRYGTVPHSGYGVGFERLICLVTGMDNVRDVIPYPRYLGKADF